MTTRLSVIQRSVKQQNDGKTSQKSKYPKIKSNHSQNKFTTEYNIG